MLPAPVGKAALPVLWDQFRFLQNVHRLYSKSVPYVTEANSETQKSKSFEVVSQADDWIFRIGNYQPLKNTTQ